MKEELIKKAKEAKSVDDLMALASGKGIELTQEEALKVFNSLQSGELGDDELNDVAGGIMRRKKHIKSFNELGC